MKAAIYKGEKSIGIEEVDVPAPAEGYVMLEMRNCGVCGSDLHSYFGEWGQSTKASGHEISGIVVECGEGVKNFKAGDRVCAECFSHCGKCRFCKVGKYNLCENLRGTSGGDHSGFAEYVIAHSSSMFHFPESLSFEQGAMIEPLAVSYRAFRKFSITLKVPSGKSYFVSSRQGDFPDGQKFFLSNESSLDGDPRCMRATGRGIST